MDEYEDLLLSITEPIDQKKRKQIESEIIIDPEEQQTSIFELTQEQEEKKFYQYLISTFTPEKHMKKTRDNRVDYLDVISKKYLIRRPYEEPNFAIYEDGSFMVRIRMMKKNSYKFKVDIFYFACLNLSEHLLELITERISIKGKYCYFSLNYNDAVEIIDDFNNISHSVRNEIIYNLLNEKQ